MEGKMVKEKLLDKIRPSFGKWLWYLHGARIAGA